MSGPGAKMSAQEAVANYRIEPAGSRLTVKVFSAGLLSALGHNPTIAARDFSGEVSLAAATVEKAYVRVIARPDTFEVTDDVSEKDKRDIENNMKEGVLEISRFPEIAFESSKVSPTKISENRYAVDIAGILTVHGETRPQNIVCQVSLNGDTLRGFGDFSLRQTDFRIKLFSFAGGALKVKDEVKCSFDLLARRQA